MNLKLSNGVRISVQNNGASRLLLFDRPVRVVELTKEESMKLGVSLTKNRQTGVTEELRKLIESGFFSEPRSFRSIKTELFQRGAETKATSLNMILTKMVRKGELRRKGQKRSYLYLEEEE